MVITDLSRMYRGVQEGSRIRKLIKCYRNPGLQSVLVYRFGHWVLNQGRIKRFLLRPSYLYLAYRCRRNWGIDINPTAVIGNGMAIPHFGGIFIGPATIGRNCTILQDTTIGIAGTGSRLGVPIIGDNVRIAPGAKIAGKIRIGNNVRIGANAVVQRDIPDNALVQLRSMQVVIFPSLYGSSMEESEDHFVD